MNWQRKNARKKDTTFSLGRFLATGTSRPCSRPRMHACIMKGERESNAARASQGKTRNFGTWYTVASFLFCICMHTYKMKVPPQKDIYIQLSQWETLQWLWNSNSAGRDLAFLSGLLSLFWKHYHIQARRGGSSIWFGSGSGSFLTGALFFVQYYNSWRSCWESSPFLAPSKRTISFWMVEATKHMVKVGGRHYYRVWKE